MVANYPALQHLGLRTGCSANRSILPASERGGVWGLGVGRRDFTRRLQMPSWVSVPRRFDASSRRRLGATGQKLTRSSG